MTSKRIAQLASLALLPFALPLLPAGCSPPPAQTPQTTSPILFVSDSKGNNVLTFKNPVGVTGNLAPDGNLFGPQTDISGPSDAAVNKAGQLLVCDTSTDRITVYDDALNTNGNLAPVRTVKGAATGLSLPISISLDRSRDVLYVLNNGTGRNSILAFADTSTAAFDGNVAPVRKITSASLMNPSGSFMDDADNLYVADFIAGNIQVFAKISTLNGTFPASRTLTGPALTNVVDVFIDRNDNLFAVITNGLVSVIKFGSSQDGNITPNNSFFVQGSKGARGIAVDAGDRGYVTDPKNAAVYVIENVSTRNETLTANGTIQGASTQLNTPQQLFLLEQ
jgi:6-phosphogluconolactonase (cycloisomerase 2 family)